MTLSTKIQRILFVLYGKIVYILAKYQRKQKQMNESDFIIYSDQLFEHLMAQIDLLAPNLDCLLEGNVLTIENDDAEQIVINRHLERQELWIAAKMGGYHFVRQGEQWLSTKTQQSFFEILNQVLGDLVGHACQVEPFFQ